MKNDEYEKFDATMRKLIKVPHSKIKAKLEEEKQVKAQMKAKGENSKGEKES